MHAHIACIKASSTVHRLTFPFIYSMADELDYQILRSVWRRKRVILIHTTRGAQCEMARPELVCCIVNDEHSDLLTLGDLHLLGISVVIANWQGKAQEGKQPMRHLTMCAV